jgi:hypothetical protein
LELYLRKSFGFVLNKSRENFALKVRLVSFQFLTPPKDYYIAFVLSCVLVTVDGGGIGNWIN